MQPEPPCPGPTYWWQTWESGLLLLWQLLLGVYSVVVFCCCFFPLLILLPSEIPKLPTDPPVRAFPTVWKLLLFHDSLPRMGLHP